MTAVRGEEGEKRYTVQQGGNRYRGEVKKTCKKVLCVKEANETRRVRARSSREERKKKVRFSLGGLAAG